MAQNYGGKSTWKFKIQFKLYKIVQNRRVCYKTRNEAVSGYFKKLGILKFRDHIKLQN